MKEKGGTMKQKLIDLLGYLLFLLLFIIALPILMITGALVRPIRFYKSISANVHNKKRKEYYY